MTAQQSERICIDGKEYSLCSYPLAQYLATLPHPPEFMPPYTSLWRGYIGTWEIKDGRLYLTAISGELESGEVVTLETLFPGFPERVLAHWYSGRLRVPQGRMLKYVHQGFASQYEQDLWIDVEQGVVQKLDTQVNGVAAPDAREGYQVAASTTLPKTSRS